MTTEDYKKLYNEFVTACTDNKPEKIDHIESGFGTFCPEVQFIDYFWTDKKDYPNHLKDNACRVEFKIDLADKIITIFKSPLFWLTSADQDKSYLAMASLKNLMKAVGKTYFRQVKFKTFDDAVKKINKFINLVTEVLEKNTDGYPYDKLNKNIY